MRQRRAIILLSGGLDSAYNLWRAKAEHEILLTLTFDYGQRAAASEIKAAARLSALCQVPHQVVNLGWFKDFTRTSLVNSEATVPTGAEVEIDRMVTSQKTARAVWVPNRNGIFLNIAAAYAEGLGADLVLTGFNAEEAATFPDNSVSFREALNQALFYSTSNHVKVDSYCATMNKTEIIRASKKIGLPLSEVWPCYFSADHWCGQCESCQRFQRALRADRSESELSL